MAKKDEDPYFRLRVPEALKAKIEGAAEQNHRSMTAEILSRLEDSFRYEGKESMWDEKIAKLQDAFNKQQAVVDDLVNRLRDK